MSVQLMDRVARALTLGQATLAERKTVAAALNTDVQTFDELPATVQRLIEDLEQRH